MIWAKEETMSRNEIEAVQLERLKDTVKRVYEHVPAYRAKMDAAGVKPEDVKSLGDVKNLPFTTKQDMRDNYPYGLFAVPRKELRRIHASSGTTGKPTVVGYTNADLEVWKECEKYLWDNFEIVYKGKLRILLLGFLAVMFHYEDAYDYWESERD